MVELRAAAGRVGRGVDRAHELAPVEREADAPDPSAGPAADTVMGAGADLGACVGVLDPGLAAVRRERDASDAGVDVAAARPADLSVEELDLPDRVRRLQHSSTPGGATVDRA